MKILLLSPHVDDIEISAGGTVARFIAEKHTTHYIAFSPANVSLPPGYKKDAIKLECLRATKLLGIKNTVIKEYETRRFDKDRHLILNDLYNINKKFQPDLVITPSSFDTHQDHHVIHTESIRAFKNSSTIWGFENPQNCLHFSYDIFVELSKQHLRKKLNVIHQYKSQCENRRMFSKDFVISFAKSNGFRCNCQYAECFELIREIHKL